MGLPVVVTVKLKGTRIPVLAVLPLVKAGGALTVTVHVALPDAPKLSVTMTSTAYTPGLV